MYGGITGSMLGIRDWNNIIYQRNVWSVPTVGGGSTMDTVGGVFTATSASQKGHCEKELDRDWSRANAHVDARRTRSLVRCAFSIEIGRAHV